MQAAIFLLTKVALNRSSFIIISGVHILMKCSRVHDAAPGDTILSITPGCVKAKVLDSPQPGGSQSTRRTFPFLVGLNF